VRESLAVFDLDRTLIRVDSFRLLVQRRLDLKLGVLTMRRALGLLPGDDFALRVMHRLAPHLADTAAMAAYAEEMLQHLDPAVLALARDKRSAGHHVLVLSASPEAYVAPLAARLGFPGIGTRLEGDRITRCYGPGKGEVLRAAFPRQRWDWAFAISDSPTDLPWMREFREHVLHRP
jgi:HAD superfamily phosphoserine phosphatase-like hydrolase